MPPGNASLTDVKPPRRDGLRFAMVPVRLPKRAKSTMPLPTSVPPRRSRLPDTALITSCSQKASEPLRPMFMPVEP